MPPLQTTYAESMQPAFVGMIAIPDFEADSRIVEGEDGIGFGLVVSRGSGERGVVLGGSNFAGISVRDITQSQPDSVDSYPEFANIGVMTKGIIWVEAGADVFAGDLVHYNTTTGVLSNAGGTLILDATWESSAAEGELAKVRLSGTLTGNAAGT